MRTTQQIQKEEDCGIGRALEIQKNERKEKMKKMQVLRVLRPEHIQRTIL